MASVYNSYTCTSGNTYGAMEDVQNYSSVFVNVNTGYSPKLVRETEGIMVPHLTSNNDGRGFIVTTEYDTINTVNAYKAVDGNFDEHYESDSVVDGWWQIQLPEPKAIWKINIDSLDPGSRFTVHASEDGTNFNLLASDVAPNTDALISDSTPYLYYRLYLDTDRIENIKFYIFKTPDNPITCAVNLKWYNGSTNIDTDTFYVYDEGIISKHYDVRAQMLAIDTTFSYIADVSGTARVTTSYKHRPTQLYIADSSSYDIVHIAGNALYTLLSDSSGGTLGNTNVDNVRALHVHTSDASGYSLHNISGALSINIVDGSNTKIMSTGVNTSTTDFSGHNALCIASTDNLGNLQAGTMTVSGSTFGGNALFFSLTDNCGVPINSNYTNVSGWPKDIQIINDNGNVALNVTLVKPTGVSVSDTHGQQMYSGNSAPLTINSFSVSLDNSAVSVHNIASTLLRQLAVTNDTANTVWLKVYDLGSLPEDPYDSLAYKDYVKFNIAVPPQTYRDITMSYGVSMERGLVLRATANYTYGSPALTGLTNAPFIYVTGTYE